MIATIRIDGDPTAVTIVTEALRTLLGPTAQLGTAQPSTRTNYAGTALARGSVDAITVAERAADVAERLGENHETRNV